MSPLTDTLARLERRARSNLDATTPERVTAHIHGDLTNIGPVGAPTASQRAMLTLNRAALAHAAAHELLSAVADIRRALAETPERPDPEPLAAALATILDTRNLAAPDADHVVWTIPLSIVADARRALADYQEQHADADPPAE